MKHEVELGRHLATVHRERHVVHVGEVPDCRHHPELCAIRIDAEAAEALGRSRGIAPGDPEYAAVLQLSEGEPGFVWRITSRADGERYGRLLLIDALTGDIKEDRENRPCPE